MSQKRTDFAFPRTLSPWKHALSLPNGRGAGTTVLGAPGESETPLTFGVRIDKSRPAGDIDILCDCRQREPSALPVFFVLLAGSLAVVLLAADKLPSGAFRLIRHIVPRWRLS